MSERCGPMRARQAIVITDKEGIERTFVCLEHKNKYMGTELDSKIDAIIIVICRQIRHYPLLLFRVFFLFERACESSSKLLTYSREKQRSEKWLLLDRL